MPREFHTKNNSIYRLSDSGVLEKFVSGKTFNFGQGFYLDRNFVHDYVGEQAHFCFKNQKEKESFIKNAETSLCSKLGGVIVFFSPKNPLKLEYSTKIIKVNPVFNEEQENNKADASGLEFIPDEDINK